MDEAKKLLLKRLFEQKVIDKPDELYEWLETYVICPHHDYWHEKMAEGCNIHESFDEISWFIDRINNSNETWKKLHNYLVNDVFAKETRRPSIGVGVLIVKDGKILLGKRKGVCGDGLWSFPGGHLEWNESIESCAQREVLEETGLTISLPKKVTFINDIFLKEDKHYVTFYMIAEWVKGEATNMEPDKCEGWEWFSVDNLPEPLWGAISEVVSKAEANNFAWVPWEGNVI